MDYYEEACRSLHLLYLFKPEYTDVEHGYIDLLCLNGEATTYCRKLLL